MMIRETKEDWCQREKGRQSLKANNGDEGDLTRSTGGEALSRKGANVGSNRVTKLRVLDLKNRVRFNRSSAIVRDNGS